MSSITLDHVSYCRYLTQAGTWTQDHYKARAIVKAIKGEPFNGYANLPVGGRNRTLDEGHPEVAFDWFVDQVAQTVDLSGKQHYFLVPIPDSKCTTTCNRSPKTVRLAQALSARIPQLRIWDELRFLREMPKSRESNMRNEDVLYRALSASSTPPTGRLILLDDVCTTGAHARAAARELMRMGGSLPVSMSVARTMLAADEQILGFRREQI